MKTQEAKCVSWLRKRTQKSGVTYYYLEIPGMTPRQEISLGEDRDTALTLRTEILFQRLSMKRTEANEVLFALFTFKQIAVPLLAPKAQKENLVSIVKLKEFFQHTLLNWAQVDDPVFVSLYADWRGSDLKLRIKGEMSLLKRVRAVFAKWTIDCIFQPIVDGVSG